MEISVTKSHACLSRVGYWCTAGLLPFTPTPTPTVFASIYLDLSDSLLVTIPK